MSITIVVGPPCAGKSSYVQDMASEGDVIVDFDRLAVAFGSRVSHDAKGDIRGIALKARWAAIYAIKDGIKSDSWIIHTSPSSALISEYIDAGAMFTVIDPGIDTCKKRAANRPDGTVAAIDKWYESPPEIPAEHTNTISSKFAAIYSLMKG